jgi:hypothetical protein
MPAGGGGSAGDLHSTGARLLQLVSAQPQASVYAWLALATAHSSGPVNWLGSFLFCGISVPQCVYVELVFTSGLKKGHRLAL